MTITVYGPNKDSTGRYLLYPGSTVGTVQYYLIGAKLCNLQKCSSFLAVVTSVSSEQLNAASTTTVALATSCSGVLPLYASSTMTALTEADLAQGTVLEISITVSGGIPSGIVLNR